MADRIPKYSSRHAVVWMAQLFWRSRCFSHNKIFLRPRGCSHKKYWSGRVAVRITKDSGGQVAACKTNYSVGHSRDNKFSLWQHSFRGRCLSAVEQQNSLAHAYSSCTVHSEQSNLLAHALFTSDSRRTLPTSGDSSWERPSRRCQKRGLSGSPSCGGRSRRPVWRTAAAVAAAAASGRGCWEPWRG